MSVPETAPRAARGGKYLTFGLADEDYGLEILKVHEILGLLPITRVPRTPPAIRGVINLRGRVIPILDLRVRFGLPAAEASRTTCIIVVQTGALTMGLLVDKVSEVLTIAEAEIEDTPSFGLAVNTDFLLGIGKAQGRVKLLLDIDRVLSGEEAQQLHELSDASENP